ncbi:hypothetical protein [Nocardia australiensis]|nr:hypothetical protein [Nocardia australiensis]
MRHDRVALIVADRVRVSRKDAGGAMRHDRVALIVADRVRVSRRTQEVR